MPTLSARMIHNKGTEATAWLTSAPIECAVWRWNEDYAARGALGEPLGRNPGADWAAAIPR